MAEAPKKHSPFHSAKTEIVERKGHTSPIEEMALAQSAYQLAFTDQAFLLREELRPIRFQLELLKPELTLADHNIHSTIAFFGSARICEPEAARSKLAIVEQHAAADPTNQTLQRQLFAAKNLLKNSYYYEQARQLAHSISIHSKNNSNKTVVVSGGGPGIMEAANRGAYEAEEVSISLNIVLPQEPEPNPYVTPELSFLFHYFALRKMHFLLRAQGLVAFPGGFGTFDELFEVLTLIQTGKIQPIPLLLFGKEFWNKVINFDALIDEGVISPQDLQLFHFVETAEEAWQHLAKILK